MEVTVGSAGTEIFVSTNEVAFVVICEDLGWPEVAATSTEISVDSIGADKVDFVVICEDLDLVEVTVGSAGTEIFVSTNEVAFVVICEDLGWLEVRLGCWLRNSV